MVLIVVLSDGVQVQKVPISAELDEKLKIQGLITENSLLEYQSHFKSNVASLLPELQMFRKCQKIYNSENSNQFLNFVMVDMIPDMDVAGNSAQVYHYFSLMSMGL